MLDSWASEFRQHVFGHLSQVVELLLVGHVTRFQASTGLRWFQIRQKDFESSASFIQRSVNWADFYIRLGQPFGM